jgi:sugar phosphate isomerase/epimerase
MQRRRFLAGALAGSVAAMAPAALAEGEIKRSSGVKLRIGLNAYSFDKPLKRGAMTLADVVDYCAAHNIDGLDATGYYFPGYPEVPEDGFVYALKRRAFLNGVTVSGTGVRNNFCLAGAAERAAQVQMVKNWTEVASKLGASVVRVFSGPAAPAGYSFDQVLEWMAPAFRECAAYGKQHGVIIGLQHHNDFLKTAEETIRVVKAVNSEWFSVILDVGSLRQGDPYEQIEKLVPYACTWQVKEEVWYGAKATPIDLPRLRRMIDKHGYRGFLPIEALGEGDPARVTQFLERVRKGMQLT